MRSERDVSLSGKTNTEDQLEDEGICTEKGFSYDKSVEYPKKLTMITKLLRQPQE